MRKIHWLLVAAIVLALVAYFRAHVAAIPAALAFVLWISELYPDPDVVARGGRHGVVRVMTADGSRERDRDRGRRAARAGVIPRITLSCQLENGGDRRLWRCNGAGLVGYGDSRTAAYDAWESLL